MRRPGNRKRSPAVVRLHRRHDSVALRTYRQPGICYRYVAVRNDGASRGRNVYIRASADGKRRVGIQKYARSIYIRRKG